MPGARKLKSRTFFLDTSLLRKFVIYAQAFRNGTHREAFGIPAFQVLTVTTTPKRVMEIQCAYRAHLASAPHPVRPGLFLFTNQETINGHDLLSVPLLNGAGRL